MCEQGTQTPLAPEHLVLGYDIVFTTADECKKSHLVSICLSGELPWYKNTAPDDNFTEVSDKLPLHPASTQPSTRPFLHLFDCLFHCWANEMVRGNISHGHAN